MNFNTVFFFLVVVALSAASQPITAKEDQVMYNLYGTAPLGTKMRPVEAKSPIPFNKKYSQLSQRQQNIFRSYFEGLKANDIPPFPENGLQEIYKPLVEGHKRVGGGGELLVFTEINEGGGVNKVIVYKSPSKELADLATTIMFNTKFKPASCDGEPCTMEFPFLYDVPQRFKQVRTLNKQDFYKRDDNRP